MAEAVYVAGQWLQRVDWRDEIDLGTAERHQVYAAGREDGYRQAMTEFRDLWLLLLKLDSHWTPEELRAALEVPDAARFAATPARRGHLRAVRA